MAGEPPRPDVRGDDTSRIVALSDGVFAIAMTLLVLQLAVPSVEQVPPARVAAYVREQLPHIGTFVLSFLVIAIFWGAHHRVFSFIGGYDTGLIWLNIIFLLCVAFLPFPTGIVGEYGGERFATTFYALSVSVTSASLSLLFRYASRDPRLMHTTANARVKRYFHLRSLAIPLVFLSSIPLSFVHPYVAEFWWLLLFPVQNVLARRFRDADNGGSG